MANIIDCVEIAGSIKNSFIDQYDKIRGFAPRPPSIALISVGDDWSAKCYLRSIAKQFKKANFHAFKHELEKYITIHEIESIISSCNQSEKIDSILLIKPISKHIDADKVCSLIRTDKDVDNLNPQNNGQSQLIARKTLSCVASAVITILDTVFSDLCGLTITLVGSSNLIGKPLALELLNRGCTVIVCNVFTQNLIECTKIADVVITAAGKPGLIRGEMIKQNATIIDVGVNQLEDTIVGDVDYDSIYKKAKYMTTVPDGVGVITQAILLKSTFAAWAEHHHFSIS